MPSKSERLAEAVLARRAELDVTQLDVWMNGGPSNSTLTVIEKGEYESLSRVTAKKLDIGLRWVPGSARRLWESGEEPLPLPEGGEQMHAEDARWLAEQIRQAKIDDQKRAELLRVLGEEAG